MRPWTAVAVLLLAGCGAESPPSSPAVPISQLPRYEFVRNSGPTVVLMATSIEETLSGPATGRIPSDLIAAGFSILVLDLPCHGADEEPGVHPLMCWRRRIEAGDHDLFRRYCKNLGAVLSELRIPAADALGLSRGGYMAATCAAYDSRIKALALLAPVTDLQRLEEFNGYAVNENEFALTRYQSKLLGMPILVRVGKQDDRVGTDAAVAFANAVAADLVLLDIVGHSAPEDGSTTQWLLKAHGL